MAWLARSVPDQPGEAASASMASAIRKEQVYTEHGLFDSFRFDEFVAEEVVDQCSIRIPSRPPRHVLCLSTSAEASKKVKETQTGQWLLLP